MEEEKFAAEGFQVVENVAGDEDAAALAGQRAEDLGEFLAAHRVQAVHGFVEDDQAGLVHEALG